jgi:hypothetical protein
VTVKPSTSCALAEDVFRAAQDAFVATGHLPAHLTASNPATGRKYRLSCSVRGNGSELVCVTAPPLRETVVVRVTAIAGQTSGTTGGKFSPTPAQVAQAKQALPLCRKEQPGITLAQLEREAASSVGIQC